MRGLKIYSRDRKNKFQKINLIHYLFLESNRTQRHIPTLPSAVEMVRSQKTRTPTVPPIESTGRHLERHGETSRQTV